MVTKDFLLEIVDYLLDQAETGNSLLETVNALLETLDSVQKIVDSLPESANFHSVMMDLLETLESLLNVEFLLETVNCL